VRQVEVVTYTHNNMLWVGGATCGVHTGGVGRLKPLQFVTAVLYYLGKFSLMCFLLPSLILAALVFVLHVSLVASLVSG